MNRENMTLTNTEWNLMECLWKNAPCSGREATLFMEKNFGWSRSTTLTMLRRMTEKGMISCSDDSEIKMYSPLIKRTDAAMHETESFLNRVYEGSLGMLVSAMTSKQKLTKQEIQELYQILQGLEE